MRIAVVGQGGREHALAWRLAREGHSIVALPGNPGTAGLGESRSVNASDIEAITAACRDAGAELVVVGPEAPLALGLVDRLRAEGIAAFGPTQAAAQIEASKAFAKELMEKANVPTARWQRVESREALTAALDELGGAVAVKADGLAAGKGVVVVDSLDEARLWAERFLERGPVVIEERLTGPELSVIALTDGERLAILPPARDHKRLLEGDEGPNTGGMGALSPVDVDAGLLDSLRRDVFLPVLAEMRARGTPFTGALYAGLMLTPQGPRVLEFNARFGDPETQALVVALSPEVSLADELLRASTGRTEDRLLPAEGAACTVVLASANYPETPRTGDPIEGIDDAQARGAIVFHAGTRLDGDRLLTAGGRVLAVTARGDTLAEARRSAIEAAALVRFDGAQWRRDIGAGTAP